MRLLASLSLACLVISCICAVSAQEEADETVLELISYRVREGAEAEHEQALTNFMNLIRSTDGVVSAYSFHAVKELDVFVLASDYNSESAYWLAGDPIVNSVEYDAWTATIGKEECTRLVRGTTGSNYGYIPIADIPADGITEFVYRHVYEDVDLASFEEHYEAFVSHYGLEGKANQFEGVYDDKISLGVNLFEDLQEYVDLLGELFVTDTDVYDTFTADFELNCLFVTQKMDL